MNDATFSRGTEMTAPNITRIAQQPDAEAEASAVFGSGIVLSIDHCGGLPPELRGRPSSAVIATRYQMLGARLLKQVQPDVILSPLFGRDFDASDLVLMLSALRFRGTLCIMAPYLPRPDLIAAELGRHCRGFKLRLIPLPL